MFTDCCDALGLEHPTASQAGTVARMQHLTPRDFAAVQRQHRFQLVRDAEMLVAALIQTSRLKNDETSARIGFI